MLPSLMDARDCYILRAKIYIYIGSLKTRRSELEKRINYMGWMWKKLWKMAKHRKAWCKLVEGIFPIGRLMAAVAGGGGEG